MTGDATPTPTPAPYRLFNVGARLLLGPHRTRAAAERPVRDQLALENVRPRFEVLVNLDELAAATDDELARAYLTDAGLHAVVDRLTRARFRASLPPARERR